MDVLSRYILRHYEKKGIIINITHEHHLIMNCHINYSDVAYVEFLLGLCNINWSKCRRSCLNRSVLRLFLVDLDFVKTSNGRRNPFSWWPISRKTTVSGQLRKLKRCVNGHRSRQFSILYYSLFRRLYHISSLLHLI